MGFIENYRNYSKIITDAPLEFHDFLSIATAAISIGDRRYLQYGHQKLFPNMYVMILAPTTFFRKSTVLSISRDLLMAVNPTKVYPSDFSQEKILEILRDNPTGAFYFYEFKSLMGLLDRSYMAGAKSFLTELFDCGPIGKNRKKEGESFIVDSPCVSLISATTTDWFLSSIKSGDIEGGFLTRFIYVHSTKKIREDSFPKAADPKTWSELKSDLGKFDGMSPYRMNLTDSAFKMYDLYYKKLVKEYEEIPPEYRSVFARLNIYVLKFAMVLQTCYNLDLNITSYTMEKSIQYANWLKASSMEMYREKLIFTKFEGEARKILDLFRNREEISHSELLKLSHMSAFDFKRVVSTLVETGQVISEHKKIGDSQKSCSVYKIKNLKETVDLFQ